MEKVKLFYEDHKSDLYIALIIFLVGISGFGLGRLSMLMNQKEPLRIEKPQNTDPIQSSQTNSAIITATQKGKYIASKSGKTYYFPWCSGAQKIKEENKIWFQTKEEALSRGLKAAGNCDGLDQE